jgi:hypothetical protein
MSAVLSYAVFAYGVPLLLNGGTFSAPATAEDTRNPTVLTPLEREGRVCGRVLYTKATDGPSISVYRGLDDTDEELP